MASQPPRRMIPIAPIRVPVPTSKPLMGRPSPEQTGGPVPTASIPFKTKPPAPNNMNGPPNPLTYPKSSEPFSPELFRYPTAEYRGCPLWAWNRKLSKPQILRQIDVFHEMGFGGFHMHVRTGLDTDYMGTEFMDVVKACVDYAESKGMLACLYDDDRWPSGAAGGKVTKEYPEHKGKHILFTPRPYGSVDLGGGCSPSSARACRSENGHLLAKYAIALDTQGCLKHSRILQGNETATAGETVWFAYAETNPPSQWFNGQTYVDTLSAPAMQRFLQGTHDRYAAAVGDRFGRTVPCIFTDEPQFATKTQLSAPAARDDVFLPYTDDLPATFAATFAGAGPAGPVRRAVDLLRDLPQLVWDLPGGRLSLARYRFHDHVCERFVAAFMDQLGAWCSARGLLLNGHMMEEPTLWSQTTALGEAMRCYRSAATLPGMDLLNDAVELNTAKQAASVARQKGSRACMSEIYGCTHWYFTFEGHKGCGDWQAALGVTFRVPHLAWLSMAGEGKRDYPASIAYQSPWWREYGVVEGHFARVGVALTRGRAVVRVAVVHPIESFWAAFGPAGGGEMARCDRAFAELTRWLLHGLVDFDFVSESLLPSQFGGVAGGRLKVGACEYDVVVLPRLRTLRPSTLRILRQFAAAGGDVLSAGMCPRLVGFEPGAGSAEVVSSICRRHLGWDEGEILGVLEKYRELRVITSDGKPAEGLLYQMRQDGKERFVFICNTNRSDALEGTVQLKASWDVHHLDTFTGETKLRASCKSAGWTSFHHRFEGCGSVLLRLTPSHPGAEETAALQVSPAKRASAPVSQEVELIGVVLSEPNVLLLDYAEYKIDHGDWSETTEILRIENQIRDRLRYPQKNSAWRQPWTVPESERAPKANVTIRFTFQSEIDVGDAARLALEDADKINISINGDALSSSASGRSWWVDEDITTLPIPARAIRKGTNVIQLEFPFGILTNVERIYLLGPFKVHLDGHKATLKEWNGRLNWGDITQQGLPFYVGNVSYRCRISLASQSQATLSVPQFSAPVLTVASARGTKLGHIALQPRTLHLGTLEKGEHIFEVKAFGNRYNSFGHVHLPSNVAGCWPDMWRTGGWAWTDDYALRPVGVLECPTVRMETIEEDEKWDDKDVTGRPSAEWVLVHLPAPEADFELV